MIKVRLPIIWLLLAMISGIYLRVGVSLEICLFSCIYILFAFIYLGLNKYYKLSISIILIALFGFYNADRYYNQPELTRSEMLNFEWTATIYETQLTSRGNQKLYVEIERGDEYENINVVIWNSSEEHLFYTGDIIEFTGFLQKFSKATYKNSFDEKMYYSGVGLHYKSYVEEIRFIEHTKTFNSIRYNLKEKIFITIDELFSSDNAGILKAILTGVDDYISKEVSQLYSRAGISHILCISGLHLSIMILAVNFIFEKIIKTRIEVSIFISMVFSFSFLVFIGFTASLSRATIMTYCMFLSKLVYRKYVSFNALAIAATIILLFNPLDLWSVGFQLSFVCVFGILIYNSVRMKRLDVKLNKFQKLLKNMFASFCISFYSSLFSFPLIAYYFNTVSIIGVFLNLLILPFCGVLLASGILSCIFAFFSMPYGDFFVHLTDKVFEYINAVTNIGVNLPYSHILLPSPDFITTVLYYLLIMCAIYYGNKFCNKYIISILMVATFLSFYSNQLFFKVNTMAFLDVGQGDSTVITTYDNKAIVIDGGGVFGYDIGQNKGYSVVEPYLKSLAITEVEAIFITHFDRDHALGAIELCHIMDVNGVYISSYPFDNLTYWEELIKIVNKKDIPLHMVSAGDEFIWEDYGKFECFAPQDNIYFIDGDDNHGSLVLKYSYGGVDTLLTGDATIEDENIILDKGYDVSSDILKLGHHGSAYSSGSDFLKAVGADVGIVSCGTNNLYNHPHPDVLERTLGMGIYRTDTMGDILLEISPSGEYIIIGDEQEQPIYERFKTRFEE